MSANPIVQYVVVRGDLLYALKWPVGALLAQVGHVCTAVTHLFYQDPHTQQYLAEIDSMRKIVLEAADEKELQSLAQTLTEANVQHKLWIEQPENYPTCLATKPCPKKDVEKLFKKFKLFKGTG